MRGSRRKAGDVKAVREFASARSPPASLPLVLGVRSQDLRAVVAEVAIVPCGAPPVHAVGDLGVLAAG